MAGVFQEMCKLPYPGHPKGCPNYGKRRACPPRQRLLPDIFNMTRPLYVICTSFDLKSHVSFLQKTHPTWSRRQLYCCLYWQGKARKNLKAAAEEFKKNNSGYFVSFCPEAMGVNVSSMMKKVVEVSLEWPVETIAYQVAIAGIPREGKDMK